MVWPWQWPWHSRGGDDDRPTKRRRRDDIGDEDGDLQRQTDALDEVMEQSTREASGGPTTLAAERLLTSEGEHKAEENTTGIISESTRDAENVAAETTSRSPDETWEFDFDELRSMLQSENAASLDSFLWMRLQGHQLDAGTKERIEDVVFEVACSQGHLNYVKHMLVDKGRDPKKPFAQGGKTPLYVAWEADRTEVIKCLIDAGADVNFVDEKRRTFLFWAADGGETEFAKWLVHAGADVNLRTEEGETALYQASLLGHTEIVEALLEADADVTVAETKEGNTPLHIASGRGYINIVELLIQAGADWNATNLFGATPLSMASTVKVARRLLEAGASLDVVDKYGRSPLHRACINRKPRMVSFLFASDSNLNVPDQSGHLPLHAVLYDAWNFGWRQNNLRTLQALVMYGCQWDSHCDAIAAQSCPCPLRRNSGPPNDYANALWRKTAPAIKICFERWMNEHRQGIPMTEVPVEQVLNGPFATKTYIKDLISSRDVVFRHKVSVVGPSNWGKTSLIKTLIATKSSLVDTADRTIGIEHFPWSFKEKLADLKATKHHKVTFWDFAGQDAYQVAHSLFFSARTLYIVCIDLQSYVIARKQAQLMTDTDSESDKWLNDFIDTKVLRWIRMICARQKEADFVFVATKKDLVYDADLEGEDGALCDLQKRLDNVEVIIREMKKEHNKPERRGQQLPEVPPITHLGDERLANMSEKPSAFVIVTSCKDSTDIDDFKVTIQRVVEESDRGFAMPDKFSRVLEKIEGMKNAAALMVTDDRLDNTFFSVEKLITSVVHEILETVDATQPRVPTHEVEVVGSKSDSSVAEDSFNDASEEELDSKHDFDREADNADDVSDEEVVSEADSVSSDDDLGSGSDKESDLDVGELDDEEPYLDEPTCRTILETLRDLGDVLWYDNIGDDELKNKIIIDPMLMIDLVREVFNHKLSAEVMTHETLQGLPIWRLLKGTPGMLSMKRVLQHFYLVYPTTDEMLNDSDLIVPAYWKSNTCAFWMFGSCDLRFGPSIDRENVAIRVHWEFHFVNNYPDTLFDHLVVASYSPSYERAVGPDWLMYMDKDKCACRVMLARDVNSHHWILHLEALVAHEAGTDQVENLWEYFELLSTRIEQVILGYPGVDVFRCARVDTENDVKPAKSLENFRKHRISGPAKKWMPPEETWAAYLEFWKHADTSSRGGSAAM